MSAEQEIMAIKDRLNQIAKEEYDLEVKRADLVKEKNISMARLSHIGFDIAVGNSITTTLEFLSKVKMH